MKNQIDQSTPFLAFYDLLRIRGIYADEEKREKLRRGFRRAMALAAVLVGLALPQSAWALPDGLAGDSRVSVSGTTMTIHPNVGANAGSGFSWDSFNVANGETVTIDATSIHTAPSFDVAGLVDAGSNILVFKTHGGNIAVSGTIRAGRFFAATFGAFDYENMSFKASDVAGGEIDISGTIPSGSILVGHTIAASGAAGTVVGTSGMDAASDITIASGGGTITFKGVMGDSSVLKAGTVTFQDVSEGTASTANGTVDAGDTGTISGDFTQSGGTVNAGEISGTLTQSGGNATANTIAALNQTAAGASATTAQVTGKATVAGTLNGDGGLSVGSLSQSGGSIVANGTLTINGAASQTGGSITATGTSLAALVAGENDVSLGQSGNSLGTVSGTAGAVTVNNAAALTFGNLSASSLEATAGGAVSQAAGTALTVSGTTAISASGANVTLANADNAMSGAISVNSGEETAAAVSLANKEGPLALGNIRATTLSLGSDATASGNITATKIDADGKTFTQNGAGTITVSGEDGITASVLGQTAGGTIEAKYVDASVSQTAAAGTIKGLDGDGASIVFEQEVTENAGTIGAAGQTLTFNSEVAQTGSGKILGDLVIANGNVTQATGNGASTGIQASTLVLVGEETDYALGGSANNVRVLTSLDPTAAVDQPAQPGSVSIDNGASDISLAGLATSGDVTVRSGGNVELAGVTAERIVVESATGQVTDTADQTADATVTLGDATLSKTVGSVLLKNGTGAITIEGVNATGDVGIRNASIAQDGAIASSGGNVALVSSGAIVVGADVTAGGDILVQSDSTVETGAQTLTANGGSIVLSGAGVTVDGTTLSAATTGKGVGMTSSDALSVQNATITAPTVVLETTGTGDLFVGAGVAMNASATSSKDAELVLKAENGVDIDLGDDLPTENLTVAKGSLDLSGGKVVALDEFAYKTTGDVDIEFRGTKLAIETDGALSVATSQDVTIQTFDELTIQGASDASVTAADATGGPDVTVPGAGDGSGSQPAGPLAGLVSTGDGKTVEVNGAGAVTVAADAVISAKGDVTASTADGKDFTVAEGGTVESTAGDVSIAAGGALDVAGTVQATSDGSGISLATVGEGDNGRDITISGTVAAGSETSRGALFLDARDNKVDQTAGTIAAGTVTLGSNAEFAGDVTAESIHADGKTIAQDGAGTIAVSGADGIVASQVSQTHDGTASGHSTIRADKIEADFVQTGAYAAVDAFTENGTLDIKGNVSQNADNGVIGSSSTNVKLGDMGKPLDQDKGTIDAKELWICENSTSAGDILAETITLRRRNGTWLELEQDGHGTITVTGAGITGSRILQSSTGTIKTDRINDINNESGLPAEGGIGGRVEQTGAATLQANNPENGLKIGGYLWQKHKDAVVGTDGENVEIFGVGSVGVLDQDAGTIQAKTLTLHGDSTSGGTIHAERIVAQADDETPKTLTQDGAGTITADSITAELVEQSFDGTAESHATIEADTIDAAFTQSGAYASLDAKTPANGLEITGMATQGESAENAVIGAAGRNVTLQGGAEQQGHGKVLAGTLTLAGNDKAYNLVSTEGNAVSAIEGTAKSVAIYDGTTDLALRVNVGTGDDNAVSVLKAGDVTLDGVTAKIIAVNEAGDVTDTENQTAATTVSLGFKTPEINKTVGNVTLKNGTGAITVEGINASGDVGIQNASITQSGAISGKNVTLDQTGDDGTLTVAGDITATGAAGETGDILVRSAGALQIDGGDPATSIALSAENGSIVVKGAGDTTVNSASLTATEVGIESTGGEVTLANASFVVAPESDDGQDGLVLKSKGDMTFGEGVSAQTSADGYKNAPVAIKTEDGELKMSSDNQPTEGRYIRVYAKSIGDRDLTSGSFDENNTIDFKEFVYANDKEGVDLKFKFTGESLSVDNPQGAIVVQTGGQDVSILKSSVEGVKDVKVEALDVVSETAGAKDSVEIKGNEAVTANGLAAKGDVDLDGTAGNGKITVKGAVSSDEGTVSVTSGGELEVASGGKVGTKTEGSEVTLASGSGKDLTVAGEVSSAGDLEMTSGEDVVLEGTVSATAGKATLAAENGNVEQKAGTLAVKDLEIKAKDISQTGTAAKSVTATGDTSLEATDGSISFAATTGTGDAVAPANDFATISKAVAKDSITVSDKNALEIAGAAGSADGVTATTGDISITAGGDLTVTAAVNAGNDAKLAGTGATVGGAVTAAQNATIDAKTGAAAVNAAVTATSGKAEISGGTVTTDANAAVKAGTDATLTASSGAVTTGSTVDAGNDATITGTGATVGGAVTAAKNATINAKTGAAAVNAAVTATSGDTTISGASVNATDLVKAENGLVSMTANGTGNNAGTVTTAAVTGKNVAIEATAGVTEGGAVTATAVNDEGGDKFVHTSGGNIAINSDFSAKNAVYKADDGEITIGDKISGVTDGLGLEGKNLIVDGTKVSKVKKLVVNSKAGDITITGKPDGVERFAIAAGGDLKVQKEDGSAVEGDFTFANGSVSVDVPAGKTADDRTVEVTGLRAGNDLTVNITGTLTTPTATAGGNVDIDAGTVAMANGTVTATRGNVDIDATTGDATVGTVTAGKEAKIVSDNGNVTINKDVTADNGAATVTAGKAVQGGGNVTANNGNAVSVTAGTTVTLGTVDANGSGEAAAGATATVTANGDIDAARIAGAGGTTVNANNGTEAAGGGAINVAAIGNGGNTTVYGGAVTANGGGITGTGQVEVNAAGAVNASQITGGGATTVNAAGQQVTVNGNLGQGGLTTVTAGGLQAGTLASGGAATLNVGGAANVGTLAVGGDLNGQVGGQFTTAGGIVGSIGQQGGFNVGSVQGGNGILQSGAVTINAGGNIGAAGAPFNINSANLQNITGGTIYLTDTTGQPITIGTITAQNGALVLTLNSAAGAIAGGGNGLESNGDMTITVTGPFGRLDLNAPIRITVNGGTLRIDGTGIAEGLLHFVMQGGDAPNPLLYSGEGFAIWNNGNGYQIVGAGPSKERLINRALAFTVNTPELKSKQGIFGDPAFVHTRMNVSEARSVDNMDMLALNAVDFYDTWEHVQSGEGRRALRKWAPKVDMGPNSLLSAKLAAQASEMETQPEVWVPGQAGAPSPAPAAPAAE